MKKLKILHVANRSEKQCGNRYYSLQYKINNGFIRNGHCVYWFSDRDIARARAIIPSQKLGKKACNEELIKVCNNFNPDIVVLSHADLITNDTLLELKNKLHFIIVQYNIDLLHEKNVAKLQQRNGVVDFSFVTTGGSFLKTLAGKGTGYGFMPNPVDQSIDCLQNFREESLPLDVFFAGQTSNLVDQADLRTQVSRLPIDLPGVDIGLFNGIWGDAYFERLKLAKIGLSISVGLKGAGQGEGSPQYLYSSDRISQYLGNGLLTFVERKFCLSDVYGADCLVEVEDYEDLKKKLIFYKNRDDLRRKKAEKSYKFAHEKINEKIVADYIVDVGTRSKYSHDYCWPCDIWNC